LQVAVAGHRFLHTPAFKRLVDVHMRQETPQALPHVPPGRGSEDGPSIGTELIFRDELGLPLYQAELIEAQSKQLPDC
jgi:hypothetical protein